MTERKTLHIVPKHDAVPLTPIEVARLLRSRQLREEVVETRRRMAREKALEQNTPSPADQIQGHGVTFISYDEFTDEPKPRRWTFDPVASILTRAIILTVFTWAGWGVCTLIGDSPWPSDWEIDLRAFWGVFPLAAIFIIMGERKL